MASNLEVTVTVKQDGKLLAGFPFYRRLQVDELQQFKTEQGSGAGYTTPPVLELATLQAFILRPSNTVTVRFANQSDGGLTLQASGLLLILDSLITSGAVTNVKIDNSTGSLVVLEGLAGGT